MMVVVIYELVVKIKRLSVIVYLMVVCLKELKKTTVICNIMH